VWNTEKISETNKFKSAQPRYYRDGSAYVELRVRTHVGNETIVQKKESAEMKFLRSVAGVTFLGFKINTEIQNEETESQKRNWYEHVSRKIIADNRLPKIPSIKLRT
jgi:hypothetical protein